MAIHIRHKNCGWLGRRRFYIWCAAQSRLTWIKDKSEDGVLRSTLRRRLFIKNYAVSIDGVFGRSEKHLLRLP